MKKLLPTLCFLLLATLQFAQNSDKISMLSTWDDDSLPGHTYGTFNEVWGYVDADGREYGIMGSAAFIHIFDVTDPTNPVEITRIEPGGTNVWRDFKTYGDRLYAVSDFNQEGLVIIDLSNLPMSASVTYQSTEFFDRSHNIFIDTENGRLYAAGTNSANSGLVVLDLTQDPDAPVSLGAPTLTQGQIGGYVHDVYVRDNMAYCSHGNTNSFIIWDFNDAANPVYIASTVSNGYNHSSWLSDDGNTVIFAEEVPTGLPLGLLDVSDMMNDNLELYQYFKFPLLAPTHEGSTPHNPFILGDLVYTSYYEDGVMVFDISDPNNPFLTAYYDTYPSNTNYNGYAGCWGVYPYLPSGNILASDMSNGLFLLKMDETINTTELPSNVKQFVLAPNPVQDALMVSIATEAYTEIQLELRSITGQLLSSQLLPVNGNYSTTLDLQDWPAGMYFVQLIDGKEQVSRKIVKQ